MSLGEKLAKSLTPMVTKRIWKLLHIYMIYLAKNNLYYSVIWHHEALTLVLPIAGLDIETISSGNPVVLRFGAGQTKPNFSF